MDNYGIRTRYVFCFEDDVQFARSMELFFVTRRLALGRDRELQSREREVQRLQDEVLAEMEKVAFV